MVDDMVLRSAYLRLSEDAQLRQLAHDLKVTKSDLIRSAIAVKLQDWLKSNDRERILEDVELGKRDEAALRAGGRTRRKSLGEVLPPASPPKPAAQSRSRGRSQPEESAAEPPHRVPVSADG